MPEKEDRGYCMGTSWQSKCHKQCPLKELEKKVEILDMEKKLKLDYMLKINNLEKNDKALQATLKHLYNKIKDLKGTESEIRRINIQGMEYWMPKADAYILKNLEDQIDKLAKYILEYFPGSIINEGACLTAIAIMEELRNK